MCGELECVLKDWVFLGVVGKWLRDGIVVGRVEGWIGLKGGLY